MGEVCNNGLFIYIYSKRVRMSTSQPGRRIETRPRTKKRIVARKALLCRFVSVNADCLRTSETRLDSRKTARRENKAKKIRHGIEYNAFVFSIFPSPLRLEVRTMVLSHVDCLDGALGYERK